MRKLHGKLTYANVMATIAVFIALGGSAFAAAQLKKNSVGAKQLKRNAVTTAKVKPAAITGAKIKLSSLGTVPSAAHAGDASTLQGTGPDGFMRGGGQFLSARRDLNLGESEVPLLSLPGISPITASCKMGTTYPEGFFEVRNVSGGALDTVLQYPGGGNDGGELKPGEKTYVNEEFIGAWTWQFASRGSPPTIATLHLGYSSHQSPTACAMIAQATVANG